MWDVRGLGLASRKWFVSYKQLQVKQKRLCKITNFKWMEVTDARNPLLLWGWVCWHWAHLLSFLFQKCKDVEGWSLVWFPFFSPNELSLLDKTWGFGLFCCCFFPWKGPVCIPSVRLGVGVDLYHTVLCWWAVTSAAACCHENEYQDPLVSVKCWMFELFMGSWKIYALS